MVVFLYNIRSLHNVGSIFRTADAAGVLQLYLAGITPAPIDRFGRYRPEITKIALGAERTVPWDASLRSSRALAARLRALKQDGYTIYAIEQSPRAIPYYCAARRARAKKKIALVFGSEVRGLPPSILACADHILEIPLRGAKESLNVSVAAGIALFRMLY